MIDAVLADQASRLLATVIGLLAEDAAPIALRFNDGDHDWLRQIGDDMAVLAAAIQVLARLTRPREPA